MSTLHPAKSESSLLVLFVGLVMIVLLQGIAIRSVLAAPLLGVAVGAAETLLAWRLSATPHTRVLRWLLAIFGVSTLVLGVYYAVAQPA